MPSARRLPLLCALALGLAAVGTALADPTRWLAGEANVDAYGTWWFQWWVAHALGTGTSPLHADVLFFPWGKDILRHTGGNVLDVVLLAPVRWAFGPALAWNVLVLGAVATNALAAGAWARRLGAGLPGVLAAQVLVGLHPFVLDELRDGRPTQALLAPLLLALAHGDDALRSGARRDLALSAGWLALAGWIYWYAASFGALALCVLAIGRDPRRLGRLVAIGAGSLVLTAPLVVPLALALARGEVPGILPLDAWWAGDASFRTAEGGAVQIATLGLDGRAGLLSARGRLDGGLVLGLATALPLLFAPRRLQLAALLALAVALGPFPLGARNPVYLALVELLPPYERLYWPVRAVAVLVAVAVPGAVAGLSRLPDRARVAVAALLCAAVLAEGAVRGGLPIGRWRPEVPAIVACLEGPGIVLPYGADQVPLVWQTVHGQPMLNGMAERSASLVPPEQASFRRDNAWVDAVLTAPRDPTARIPWTPADKAAVATLGYRWVLLRAAELVDADDRASPRARLRAAQRALRPLLGDPVVSRDDVVLYAPWGGLDRCRAAAADAPSSDGRAP